MLQGASPRAGAPAEPASRAICFDCFWNYQPAGFREELGAFYDAFETSDPLVAADVRLLLARVRGDAAAECEAVGGFARLAATETDPARRLLVEETLAFAARACGGDPAARFDEAARLARRSREGRKAEVYRRLARGGFRPEFGETLMPFRLEAPEGAWGYVLGESAIRVGPRSVIGAQVERVVRDWLSYQMAYDFTAGAPPGGFIGWHEGARIAEIVAASGARVLPLPGTLAARREGRWLAPDEKGVFRFPVLDDKVEYPTTRADGDLALLVDTHGISAIAGRAAEAGVDLVVGCGDSPGKAAAAYHLARLGIPVYFPCDRMVGDLLGHDGRATLLGSAPVRGEGKEAVIGDRPVTFRTDETVVVEDTLVGLRWHYCDAPARYFRKLGRALPLKLEFVLVEGPGGTEKVVRRAAELGAAAIAVRVETEGDYLPVRDWLAGSEARRAVLFHSAPYPHGYRLFAEFPGRTTFGDPRPRFLTRR